MADDPDVGEIAYRVTQFEEPLPIPAASVRPFTYEAQFDTLQSNAAEVVLNIDPAGLVTHRTLIKAIEEYGLSPEEVAELIAEHNRAEDSHRDIRELIDRVAGRQNYVPDNWFGGVRIHVTIDGMPMANAAFTGLPSLAANVTDEHGFLTFYAVSGNTMNIALASVPVGAINVTHQVTPIRGQWVEVEFAYKTALAVGDVFEILTSANVYFPPTVTAVDLFLLGGGGNGGDSRTSSGYGGADGGGGGGGYGQNVYNVPVSAGTYSAIVGAGGGGITSFLSYSALGGNGGGGGAPVGQFNWSGGIGENGGSGGGGGSWDGGGSGKGGIHGANGNPATTIPPQGNRNGTPGIGSGDSNSLRPFGMGNVYYGAGGDAGHSISPPDASNNSGAGGHGTRAPFTINTTVSGARGGSGRIHIRIAALAS